MQLIEAATSAIVEAERRLSANSANIANVNTPGYKREISYSEIVDVVSGAGFRKSTLPEIHTVVVGDSSTLIETGGRLDLAVRGQGHFLLRAGEQFFLVRSGQFTRDESGALVDSQGRIVQQAGGGDLVVDTDLPEILPDGTVLSDSVPVGSIGLYLADDAMGRNRSSSGLSVERASALVASDAGTIAQGMVERSNVTLSDEMIGLMRARRMAEAGAQLVRAYDQLMGQAVSTFGRPGS